MGVVWYALFAKPHARVMIVENTEPTTNVFFLPYKSAIRPNTRRRQPYTRIFVLSMVAARMDSRTEKRTALKGYADTGHCNSASSNPHSLPMVGKEIDTTVALAT